MVTAFCPNCGKPVGPSAAACAECGAALPAAGGAATPASPPKGRVPLAPVALVVVGVLVALGAVLVVRNEDGGTGDGGEPIVGEVFLEAAAAPGPDPFTEPVDPVAPASSVVATPVSGPLPVAPAGVSPVSGTAPPPGSPPYGGSGDDTVCDREKLVSFLTSQPDRAAAWAGVHGLSLGEIPAFVRSLTPSVLLYDTRVTNHGFAGGRATPRQSVLQAGTAVLVDANGDPAVRCRCGNPLLAPVPVSRPAAVGPPWPGYDPTALVAVQAGVTVTVVVEVTDPGTTATTAATGSTTGPAATGSTATTGTTSATTATTAPSLTPNDLAAAEGLVAAVSECRPDAAVVVVDVEALEGFTGSFTVTLDVGGTRMLVVYEPATGTITEGDRASAALIAECGLS
jgi:hypothetical protein